MSTRRIRCTTIKSFEEFPTGDRRQAPTYQEMIPDYDPYIVHLLRKLERTPPCTSNAHSPLPHGHRVRAAHLEAQPPLHSPAPDFDILRRLGDWAVPDLPDEDR